MDPFEVVAVGDEIEALVQQKEDKEGRLILSKKRAQYERAWGTIEKVKESDGVVTGKVIEVVNARPGNLVFLLWGSHAQSKQKLIDTTRHLVLKSAHPSPLSAYRGFLGNGHFSRTNQYLKQCGLTPIDWRLPLLPA